MSDEKPKAKAEEKKVAPLEERIVGVRQEEQPHVTVELKHAVGINGRFYGPGVCQVPEASEAVWGKALIRKLK